MLIESGTKILCSGKFLSRHRTANQPVGYSVGYSYSTVQAGVTIRLSNGEFQNMELRLTPEQANKLACELIEWAKKTESYQKTV